MTKLKKAIFFVLLISIILTNVNYTSFAESYSIDEDTLTIYSNKAFVDNEFKHYYFSKIIFSDGVTYIPNNAFDGNQNITEITFSDSLEYVGSFSFYCCRSLEKINFGNGIKYTSTSSFSGCDNLNHVYLPDSFEEIGESCFYRCYALDDISLPKTMKKIGKWAFYYCSSLEHIDIPSSVQEIGDCAFYRCFALKDIAFPEGLTTIPGAVCYQCFELRKVTIPQSATYVKESSFEECKKLQYIDLKNVVKFDYCSFNACEQLKYAKIANECEYIDESAFDGTNVKLISSSKYVREYADNNDYEYIPTKRFDDVSDTKWYYNAIEYCSYAGYFAGTGNGMFSPNNITSRSMAITTLYKASNASENEYGSDFFDDVKLGCWYNIPCGWAVKNQIASGISSRLFAPNKAVTRQEFILMLYKTFNDSACGDDCLLEQYSDYSDISFWAKDAMSWAVSIGIIKGTSPDRLSPLKNLTRAECAQILYSYCIK